ncbi:YbfB/YjiJ family MFS transporter [Alkalicoccus chagannorensis]|uniref:YbfB/YjiJ family MFS transporter n=1 Tax=Alkalicoccus chagannorensis TaxID=427072 RepID=UPI000A069B90|nr:YbfB/YjiJ family MFS transporter [Alkalicoccus chagannorensis]
MSPQALWQKYRSLAAGAIALALVMGIGRFVYTPILPLMEVEGLSTTAGGALASANYAGYMIGALAAVRLKKSSLRLLLLLLANVLFTWSMAYTDSLFWMHLLRFLSGLSSGLAFVLVSALILAAWRPRPNGMLYAGILFGGVGAGIFLSGALTPLFQDADSAWVGFGIVSLLLLAVAAAAYRHEEVPEVGDPGVVLRASGPHRKKHAAAYFFEGFGYIIFATYIVSMLVSMDDLPIDPAYVWAAVGLGVMPSCVFWAVVARRRGTLAALRMAYVLQLTGMLLPVLNQSVAVLLFSAICFGGTFMGITMLTMTYAPITGQRAIGVLTGGYGLGQLLGPLAAAWVIVRTEPLMALVLGAAALAAALVLIQNMIREERRGTHAIREY